MQTLNGNFLKLVKIRRLEGCWGEISQEVEHFCFTITKFQTRVTFMKVPIV